MCVHEYFCLCVRIIRICIFTSQITICILYLYYVYIVYIYYHKHYANYMYVYRGVNQVAFHTDGAAVASAGQDKSINIWDIRSRQLVQHYSAHTDSVSSISFHPVCIMYCICCVYCVWCTYVV